MIQILVDPRSGPEEGGMHVRSRRAISAVALATILALTAVACGSGRSSSSGDDGSGGGTATTVATSADGQFGTLESPCGPGDATGATDTGVTDTQIDLGYGDDAGYPSSPGLNHQMSDAMKAFISWCNDQGGINGRQIKGNYHDAKILDVNNAMIEACQSDFFLVGQGFSLDASQEQTRRGCGLPSVAGYAVSPQFANAPLKWEPFPIPADYTNATAALYFQEQYPEKTSKIASMFGNYSATIDSKDKVEAAWKDLGYTFLDCPQQYNIQGEADWKPFVQKLKDCGAEIVYFVGSPYPNFENALTAADQIGFKPIWYVDANFYDTNFRDWNTSGFADNVYIRESYTPLEEASENPATQQYLDVMKKYGGDINQLGEQSASAFLLWATAAKACGSNLTRACVGEQLDKVTEWTGGGLHAQANPGENLPSECGMILKMQGTTYVRVSPSEANTYTCDPRIAAKVTGPALDRAKLDANRQSAP
jgi:ABC-type branched-subunit amino acid transport system substrate-binding protein